MNRKVPMLTDFSGPGRQAASLPECDVPQSPLPENLLRSDKPALPEVGELDLVRYFTRLSQLNFSIDSHFYPLGSCTMKYNPKINEAAAALACFSEVHPHAPSDGVMEILFRLQKQLAGISGFQSVSLQPAAGAQGELAGVMMIRSYHRDKGNTGRTKMLIPDSAHGTNPASVAMCGYTAVEVPSDADGNVDLHALTELCDETVAGLMITNPNTLGLFECRIREVVDAVHECGGLVYGDGANLNAIMGILRPGDLDIDVMHFNLHKTFSTPHGGGGPGAGPVGAGPRLSDYLPGPIVVKGEKGYEYRCPEKSIGRLKAFNGNFGMLLRAYVYIRMNGAAGLRNISETAVLNANYLKELLEDVFPARYKRRCMHEFVTRGDIGEGVHTVDIAKRLIDYGFHPPTVYFPLIVKEAMMIEPTETESRETIEAFADALKAIALEARENPQLLAEAPQSTPVRRLDEVRAARELVLRRK